MAKPAKSLSERKKELIDAQDHLSEKEKKKAKEEVEKTEKIKASKKEETRKILEEEQKEFKKAAEKSAAGEEIELFKEEDFEEDEKDEKWYKEFEEGLKEETRKNKEKDLPGYRPGESEESKYLLSPTVRASMQRSENMYNAYKSGEEWLMSEGENDLVKGFINNFRSAIGTGVEDFAFWLMENAPWYKPAEKVLENNMAGKIEEQAKKQFGNAKANGVNGNVVDFLDSTSKGLGYNIFGVNVGNYIQPLGEGFEEYRSLRDSGYTKEEATFAMAKKAPMYILSTKADDYIGKNSKVDEVLYGKNGIAAKADDILSDIPKKSTIAERIEKGEISSQIHKGQQRKHIEGTKEYRDKYKDGSNPQDILTISMEEAQELVNKYGGKGDPGKRDINGIWTEFADADYVVGKYYSNGEYHETKRFTIHYSKKGAHVIPVRPKGVMKK